MCVITKAHLTPFLTAALLFGGEIPPFLVLGEMSRGDMVVVL